MTKTFNLKRTFQQFCFIFIFLGVIVFQTNFQVVRAFALDNYQTEIVIEELRLKVPSDLKEVWLKAEKKIWEPWLLIQDGFLGREIYWDKGSEEALILINWENKKLWKSISTIEVNEVQEKFVENVKSTLNLKENPFKLVYEGELEKPG